MKLEWIKASINRRNFLKGSTALGAASVMPLAFHNQAWAQDSNTLRVRTYGDAPNMDPAHSVGVVEEEIHSSIYNKLIQYKPGKEWDWQLDAATMIEQVDPTHIKFALRDDIGFTNGHGPMTAEDVKYSFERIIADATESPNKPDMGSLSHVDVMGEREGVIVLKEPFAPLRTIALPYITGNILSKSATEAAGGRIGSDPVAESGPYLRASWSPKQKTVLKRIRTGKVLHQNGIRLKSFLLMMRTLPRSPLMLVSLILHASRLVRLSVIARVCRIMAHWLKTLRFFMSGWG